MHELDIYIRVNSLGKWIVFLSCNWFMIYLIQWKKNISFMLLWVDFFFLFLFILANSIILLYVPPLKGFSTTTLSLFWVPFLIVDGKIIVKLVSFQCIYLFIFCIWDYEHLKLQTMCWSRAYKDTHVWHL